MQTVTIDILNEKAIMLLRSLELQQLIKVHGLHGKEKPSQVEWKKYKGAMTKQPESVVEEQLTKLRNDWE